MANLQSIKAWDDETDVLIAGYGVAGCAAAIEAHDTDPDADILIVEKMPAAHAGGNSRVSGQSLLISHNADALYAYQKAMSATNPPPDDMLREWAQQMAGLESYIEARVAEAGTTQLVKGSGWSSGEAVYEFPEFGAAEAVAYNAFIKPIPSGVWITMRTCVENRPRIRHLFESPIVDLVQDPDTLEVFGVIVETHGVRRAIRARRGVILAVGGYEADMEMQRNYFGLAEAYPIGTPANTGDGVRILQKAGAELWHMRNFGQSGGIWPGIKVAEYPTIFMRRHFWQTFSWIEIGADDQRFYNEGAELYYTHYKEHHHGHWVDTPHWRAGPVHMLFDENVRLHNCLITHAMSWNTVVDEYEWSDDNSIEVERGWVIKADTIAALAEKIGRDPARVEAAVTRFGENCARGVDQDFGRPAHTLQPLVTPPYYAVKIDLAIVCTSGGAKRNIRSQVLDPRGAAILRLHEAGELGSMISHLYQNGSYLTEAMISGRAAGRSAVALPAWQALRAA